MSKLDKPKFSKDNREMMNEQKEFEKHQESLVEIQKMPGDNQRRRALQDLAEKVGASKRFISEHRLRDAAEPELIDSINDALQTETMIDMCRTAAQNYEIAVTATKAAVTNNRIAAAIAILSMLAAWAAVLVSK